MAYTPNNPYIAGDPYSYDLKWVVERLKALKDEIIRLEATYTTPTVVDTAAEFTDRNKIYVYVGSEVGYNNGHWYYYDPDTNLWTDGGIYGSITPDATLSTTSTNAVENRVITNALATKFNTADIDSALNSTSTNPVENRVVTNALAQKQNTITFPLAISSGGTGQNGTGASISNSVTRISGGSLDFQDLHIWGKMAVLDMIITTDTNYAPGTNAFTGSCSYLPVNSCLGIGYSNDALIAALLAYDGNITLRIIGDTVPIGTSFSVSIMFMLP